jgi:hypothetical protein
VYIYLCGGQYYSRRVALSGHLTVHHPAVAMAKGARSPCPSLMLLYTVNAEYHRRLGVHRRLAWTMCYHCPCYDYRAVQYPTVVHRWPAWLRSDHQRTDTNGGGWLALSSYCHNRYFRYGTKEDPEAQLGRVGQDAPVWRRRARAPTHTYAN